jgi:uncharacterized ferritin-like protein (DUF455 family)
MTEERDRRTRSARKRRNAATTAEAQQAARQREVNRQLRVWTPRRIVGWALVGLAIPMAVVHWVAHLGYRAIPLSMGAQDLFLGYPAAGLLGVTAAIILSPAARKPKR